jgi:hypothetical protein
VDKQLRTSEKESGMEDFNGVKVFTATKAREREGLGELITSWIRDNDRKTIVDKTITQSSDSEFHCLTITLFYQEAVGNENRTR